MGGPRFSIRRSQRITPFVHALFGVDDMKVSGSGEANGTDISVSAGTSGTGLAMALGGGLDVKVNRVLAIRLGQVDYLMTHTFGESLNNLAFTFGANLRFGGK
jgi:hypothetical protein